MRSLIIIITILAGSFLGSAQSFPGSWIGEYKGKMTIGYNTGAQMFADVEFSLQEVVKDSVWTYTMKFNSDAYGEIVKDYHICRPKKNDTINYLLDEKDGIIIPMVFMNNTFYSLFEVSGNIINSTIERRGNDLYYDLTMASQETKTITNSVPMSEEEQSYKVTSYPAHVHQTVLLKRQ